MLDLILATGHHLTIFALFGVLTAELVMLRPGMDAVALRRIASVDLCYGILAAVILAFGFARAVFAAKGWAFYQHNALFWAKIGLFFVVGLISVPPTITYLRWNREGAEAPTDREITVIRRLIWLEVGLFAALPVLAAAMARGYGEIS
jgi:putative membrane protein